MEQRKNDNSNNRRKSNNSYNSYNSDNNSKYSNYYNNVLVKEQPFYRKGMSEIEARRELNYLNNNLKSFFEGKYKPLWRQNIYR